MDRVNIALFALVLFGLALIAHTVNNDCGDDDACKITMEAPQ